MAEVGYIYRHPAASGEELRGVLAAPDYQRGWLWSPLTLELFDPSLLETMSEGRVSFSTHEVRWRHEGSTFDVLLLSLTEQHWKGFQPLHPLQGVWRLGGVLKTYRLKRHSDQPGKKDTCIIARSFLAPDGSAQFIALLEQASQEQPDES